MMRFWIKCNDYWKMMTKSKVQALFQTKVSADDPNDFAASWGPRLRREANTVHPLSVQPLFL